MSLTLGLKGENKARAQEELLCCCMHELNYICLCPRGCRRKLKNMKRQARTSSQEDAG